MSDESEQEPDVVDNKEGKYAGLKFIGFNKFVAQIGGNNSKFSRRLTLTGSTDTTFFIDTLTKWNDQDHSASFQAFVNDIPIDELQSYAQMLHKKDTVVKTLLKYLNLEEGFQSIPAFCELLAAVARDLKEEFNEYIWMSFESLMNILDIGKQERSHVESTFYCLTILVKILWKELVKNIKETFCRFIPLFGSSRPYVRRFAAESFSFILRKLSDLRKIIPFIIKQASKAQDNCLKDGCAELFFNIYKSFSGKFHSATEQYITEIIHGSLSINEQLEREYGFQILSGMMQMTVGYTRRHKSSLETIETVILNNLESAQSMEKCTPLLNLMRILFCDEQNGVPFSSKKRLLSFVKGIISAEFFEINPVFATFLSQAVLHVFHQSSFYMAIREIFTKIVDLSKEKNYELLLDLFLSLKNYHGYDLYLMPSVGDCARFILARKPELMPKVISIYAEICQSRKPLTDVIACERSAFFDLTNHIDVKKHIFSKLCTLWTLDPTYSAHLVIVYPWLFTTGEKIEGAEHLQTWLLRLLNSADQSLLTSELCYILGAALFLTRKELLASVPRHLFEELISHCNCSHASLCLLRLYILTLGVLDDIDYFCRVTKLLTPLYFCPSGTKRKAALEILDSFSVIFEGQNQQDDDGNILPDPEGMFKVLLSAENTELSDSRTRLLYFRKLRYGAHIRHLPKDYRHEFEHIILRYGLSQFFVQFTLLWPGMHELLSSFARGMETDDFWTIMGSILKEVQCGCRSDESAEESESSVFISHNNDNVPQSKYLSARVQILKFISTVSDLAERRTRILAPLLVDFYENDFKKPQIHLDKHISDEKRTNKTSERRKALCAFLGIFSKFKDAKSVYLERKLYSIYNELLLIPDSQIMKAAFACIVTYRQKELLHYKESIDKLIEEKTFKEGLVALKIVEDDGDAVLLADHRHIVMPVLTRILHGKLRMHCKKKISGSRAIAVFRYIGGFRPEELQYFLDILFNYIIDITGSTVISNGKIDEFCKNVGNVHTIDMGSIQSTLNTISGLIQRVPRAISDDQQTQIINVLIAIGVLIKAVLKTPTSGTQRIEKCREQRKLLLETISEFFTVFSKRCLSKEELKQILAISINCYLQYNTTAQGDTVVTAPLSVLRMIANICKLPAFWPILSITISVVESSEKLKMTVLQMFISHLFYNGLTSELLDIIREGMLNMLSLSSEQTAVDLTDIEHLQFPIDGGHYGTSLLIQYLPLVLQFLIDALENDSKKSIKLDNLELLHRISEYAADGEIGERVIQILLFQLEKSLPKEEILQKLLLTLARLINVAPTVKNHLPKIARLFSTIEGRIPRDALIQVIQSVADNNTIDTDMKSGMLLAIELESWDQRKVNEPDHVRRHTAYNKLFDYWNSETIYDESFLYLIIHAHFYTLFNTTDIALRSSAATNLRALAEHISRNNYNLSAKTKLVDKNFISLMLKGFRNDAEIVREECVRLLSTCVTLFPTHPQLSFMVQLQNDNQDLDFFTNLNHIQLHRRQRCINRLVNGIRENKIYIPFEVLYRFIIPIVYHYLLSLTSKTSALSDECLRLYNITLELTPWPKYISILEHWITRLDRETGSEKSIIRVLVSVIDAFHFAVAEPEEILLENKENAQAITIRDKVTKDVLPRLRKCVNGKTSVANVHKKARTAETKRNAEDDDIMRAPVALASVKLLQKLPEKIMNQHLYGVILKLCRLMIARGYDVRDTARKIGLQVCDCLGAKYLPSIIKEMKIIMNKGFQVHVVIYTVHTFIYHLRNILTVGNLDDCLEEILDLCIQDQFGAASEEKEVGAIRYQVAEAKANKTPETLLFLGKFVSSSSLGIVLEKFHEVLVKKSSSKLVGRMGILLTKFATGIKENKGLTPTVQLVLIHQLLTTNIEKMENTGKNAKAAEDLHLRPQSCLVLPEAPKRVGALVKTSVKSRVHVFVEFALQLLSYLVAGKHMNSDDDAVAKLGPFIPLVSRCLVLKYDKVISIALRCMIGLLYLDIPSLHSQLKSVAERLFVLLADYSILGNAANKHTIIQLNSLLFKAFTKIIALGDTTVLSKRNVEVLLSYIETDVMDTHKQATAFSLVKVIIRKRIEHDRLPEVVQILAELSITSTQNHIRTQCRDVVCEFIGNHPQSGNAKKWIEFFIAQLEYEYEEGRLSAAETLHKLFSELLSEILDENFFFCILKLSLRLVNDDSLKCRKYIGMTLRKLLENVSESSLEDAASAGYDWLESEKEASKIVGIELFVQLSFVEGNRFASRLPRIFSATSKWLSMDNLLEENSESSLISVLKGSLTLLQNCGEAIEAFNESPLMCVILSNLKPIFKCNDSLPLCHAASSFIGQCFSAWETVPPSVVELVEWMCWLLKHKELNDETAEQCSKNIIFLSKWLSNEDFEQLIKRLAIISKFEMVKHPKESIKRITCFKLAAALALKDDKASKFSFITNTFLPLFVREMNRISINGTDDLYNLAIEIGEIIKARIGEQDYISRLSTCQKLILTKKEERKRVSKEMSVKEPEKATEMKRMKNKKKVQAKKRKLDELKPYRVAKRKFLERKRLLEDED